MTVTIRLSTEVDTLSGGGERRQRISDIVRLHDGQWRFDMSRMVVTCSCNIDISMRPNKNTRPHYQLTDILFPVTMVGMPLV
jgi:hypothetical protein